VSVSSPELPGCQSQGANVEEALGNIGQQREFHYWGFISYSQKDEDVALWLHQQLEHFVVPDDLVGKKTGRGYLVPDRIRPMFRDRDELPSSSDLTEGINDALSDSRYLIVICSPNSAKSLWVNEEILNFKRLGKANRILTLIIDGEPNATHKKDVDDNLECFPEALRYKPDLDDEIRPGEQIEPLAADCRKRLPNGKRGPGRRRALLKIVAGVIGVDFDEIYHRHERAARRALAIWAGIATALVGLLASLSWYAFQQRDAAMRAQREADSVVNYLLEDLQPQLEQAGRIDLLQGTVGRVEEYLRNRPKDHPEIAGRMRLSRAKIRFSLGKKDEAIRELESVRNSLGMLSREDAEAADVLAWVNTTLGDYYAWKVGGSKKAKEVCREAITTFEKRLSKDSSHLPSLLGLASAKNFLADLYGKDGDTDHALQLYKEAESLFSADQLKPAQFASGNGQYVECIRLAVRGRIRSAGLLNRAWRSDQALHFLDSAAQLLDQQLELQPKNTVALEQRAMVFAFYGWAYSHLNDQEKAQQALDQAIATQKRLISIEPQNDNYIRDLAGLYLSIGDDPNLPPQARRDSISQALKILVQGYAKDKSSLDWKKVLARAYRMGAERDLLDGRVSDATTNYQKLFALDQEATSQEDIDLTLRIAEGRVGYARALIASGSQEELSKRAALAIEQLRLSESTYQRVYALDQDSGHLRGNAVIFDARGEIFEALGDSGQARNAYMEGLRIRKKLRSEATDNNHDILVSDLAVNQERLARLERGLQNYTGAVDDFVAAIELQQQLVDRHPDNQEMRLALTQFLLGKAGTLQEAGRFDDALTGYGNAQKHLQVLLMRQPDNPKFLRELSLSNYRRGKIALACHKPGEAAALFAESWQEYDRLYQIEPVAHRPAHLDTITSISQAKAEAEIAAGQPATATNTFKTLAKYLRELSDAQPEEPHLAVSLAKATLNFGNSLLNQPDPPAEHVQAAQELLRAAREALLVAKANAADLETDLSRLREKFNLIKP